MKNFYEIKNVLTRKCIHFLIAFTPFLCSINYPVAIILLCAGMIYYAFIENCRFTGGLPFFNLAGVYIVKIAIFASHRRDKNRFILGPLTLGAGALYALLFFDSGSAAAAIYALAFGDGFAGLVGCVFGRIRPRFLKGKSLEGSIACFTAILISSMLVTHDFTVSFICAVTGTIIEALPIEDFDNVFLPLAIGAVLALVGAP